MDPPTQTAGPDINGEPSVISLLTPEQLTQYPYLTSLRSLMNAAFAIHGAPANNYLIPHNSPRLQNDYQIQAELGSDFFTYIVHAPIPANDDPPRLYASASGRPYGVNKAEEGVAKEMELLIPKRRLDSEEYEAWELKMLVVEPALQKQGLASLLMKLVEAEIVKRSAERWLQLATMRSIHSNGQVGLGVSKNETARAKRVVLVLDTIREINEAYYLRRGFATTEVIPMQKGVFGSIRDWEMSFMQKDVTT